MSTNPDDIVIRIAGDLSDIQKSLRELRRQTREAGEEAKRSQRDWQALGQGLDNLRTQVVGLVSAYFSLRTVGSVFRTVVQNTREQEDAIAQLEARLRSTGGVIGLTSDELQRMAAGFRDVSTFTEAAIMSAQGVLLTYTQIGRETFPRALQAAIDFATAMRIDVARAAETVGKALGEPSKAAAALARQGFTFTGQQLALIRSLEETGRVAEAQAIILEELELAYGGAAEAARGTFGGALDALKVAFGDLMTGQGGNLRGATDALNELTELLRDPRTVDAFENLTSAVLTLSNWFVTATAHATRFVQMMGEIIAGGLGFGAQADQLEREARRLETEINRITNQLRVAEQTPRLAVRPAEELRAELERLRRELESVKRAQLDVFAPRQAPTPRRASTAQAEPVEVPTVDARPALARLGADLRAAGILLTDELKRLRDQLDREFRDNLVSFEEYYRRRAEIETRAIDQQLAQQRNLLDQLNEEIRIREISGEVTEEVEARRAEVIAQITVLERQRGDVARRASLEQADAARMLADQLATVRERLAELQGDTIGARTSALEREFRDLLQRLQAEGDREGEELVRRLIDVETARAQLDALERDYESALARLARAQRRIDVQVQTGVISEREGRRQIIDLHRETAEELQRLIPLMQQLAAATGDPAAIERLEDMQLEMEELAATAKTAAQEIAENLRDAGEDAFSSWLDGTRSAKDAFENFLQTVRSRIADLLAERLFDRLFAGLPGFGLGGGGGAATAAVLHGGGIAGLATEFRRVPPLVFADAPRLHDGGLPLRPGEVPAILRRDEEVLTASDPRHRNNLQSLPVQVNIYAQDAQSFRRMSPGQIGAQVANELLRARNRNG